MRHWIFSCVGLGLVLSPLSCKKSIEKSTSSSSSIRIITGTGKEFVKDIIRTNDGGFLFLGYTEFLNQTDAFCLKVSNSGKKEWYRNFGGGKNEIFNCGMQTKDGGYLLAGFTASYGFDTSTGSTSGYAVKLDAAGNKEWMRTFFSRENSIEALSESTKQEYIFTGFVNGNASTDITLAKTNLQGQILSEKIFDTNYANIPPGYYGAVGFEYSNALVTMDDGSFLLGGIVNNTYSAQDYFNFYTFTMRVNSNGTVATQFSPYLQYARNGSWYFRRVYSGAIKRFIPVKIIPSVDGYYLGTSLDYNTDDFELQVLKTSKSGDIILPGWHTEFRGLGAAQLAGMQMDGNGNILVLGSSSAVKLDVSVPDYFSPSRGVVLTLSSDGQVIKAQYYSGGDETLKLYCRQQIGDGFMLAGYQAAQRYGNHKMCILFTDKTGELKLK